MRELTDSSGLKIEKNQKTSEVLRNKLLKFFGYLNNCICYLVVAIWNL